MLFSDPQIPAWIQAIAALIAVPGAIAGFIFLFRKDKDKQPQIDKLTGIAEELKEIAAKIEGQNEILKESNRLLSEQVDVLRTYQVAAKQDAEGARKLAEVEEKKFKLSIKPFFIQGGGSSSQDSFTVRLNNIGELANVIGMEVMEGNVQIGYHAGQYPILVLKGKDLHIPFTTKDGSMAYQVKYKIAISFSDQQGNRYQMTCEGVGPGKASISEAVPV